MLPKQNRLSTVNALGNLFADVKHTADAARAK